jgi:hypothetical protein
VPRSSVARSHAIEKLLCDERRRGVNGWFKRQGFLDSQATAAMLAWKHGGFSIEVMRDSEPMPQKGLWPTMRRGPKIGSIGLKKPFGTR